MRNLVAEVSIKEPVTYGKGNRFKVLSLDCGIKVNIIRSLVKRDCEVTLLPWDTPLLPIMQDYDSLFLSNGPGNPAMLREGPIKHIKEVLDAMTVGQLPIKPIFGICLGNQMLSMAAGASTYKLPFGNRGQNQPVLNLLNNRCVITPQNHGYAVDAEKLPKGWRPLFQNRNDGSNEGIMHESHPWFSAQFHPEAKSGPSDTSFLFDIFTGAMAEPTASIVDSLSTGKYVPLAPEKLTKVLLLGSGGREHAVARGGRSAARFGVARFGVAAAFVSRRGRLSRTARGSPHGLVQSERAVGAPRCRVQRDGRVAHRDCP